jgi:hypothetical protein
VIDYRERDRVNSIKNGFEKYPWLAEKLQKSAVREFTLDINIGVNFFKSRPDDYRHLEVLWFFDKEGKFLGEVDEVRFSEDRKIGSFFLPKETVLQALERFFGKAQYIVKNINFTHITLFVNSENKNMLEYANQFPNLRT